MTDYSCSIWPTTVAATATAVELVWAVLAMSLHVKVWIRKINFLYAD
jgi:hypothetical protein